MALQDDSGSTDSETTLPTAMDNKIPLDMEVSSIKSIQSKEQFSSGDDHTLKVYMVRKPYTITKQRERWTEDEHKKFLEALKLYGRAWRRIEEHVGTKTAVQIRSHAQKFFSKVVRESNNGDSSSVKPIEIPPPRPKRKPLHPYPRKLSTSVKSGALALEKPSAAPNVRLHAEANQSPTSVLSALHSDAPGTTDSNTPEGSLSPVSSVVGGSPGFAISEMNLSSPKVNTSPSSSQINNNNSNQDEKSPQKLELFPEDNSFVKEGSVEVSSSQCLKLFGKTVLVTDSCRASSPTHLTTCKVQSSNNNDANLVQALQWNFIPINYSQGALECSWSALPFGTQATLYCLPLPNGRSNATASSPSHSLPWWTCQGGAPISFVQVHSPIPTKAPCWGNMKEVCDKEVCKDGSSSDSNAESENAEADSNRTRLLKKFLKEQEAAQQHQKQLLSSGDESESPESSVPARNLFDLLIDDDDNVDHHVSGKGDELKTANELGKQNVAGKHPAAVKFSINSVLSSNHKSKKKKKKSKEDLPPNANEHEKSSDATLENLSIGNESNAHKHVASFSRKAKSANLNDGVAKQLRPSILQVDPKFLVAENELRRIFGSKVVNSFEKSQQAGNSRQSLAGRRGSHSHRRTILVSPSEHWPRWDGSLSMELLESTNGVNCFRYVHSSSYSQAQRAFEAAKAIHDLNGIANILLHHPYHIDSLITLAEYFKFSGELQMSADATAKCLYGLECAWHPMFTPLKGNCQLKYSHETNKPVFSTLFTHMKNMDRRGCHRSALEICKLLLALDSDDPVGALFCIDYYALRAEEYSWLEQFSEEYGSDNSLWLFPNFSYSLAVCRFYLEQKEQTEDIENGNGKACSNDLMKQALMLHPSVLRKLVAKVPLKEQVWTSILQHSFFKSEQSGSPSLDHLVNVYIERSYLIWRLPDLQKLLRDSAHSVIETLKNKGSDANDWACVRKEAFSSEKNEYRHLLLSDFSDSVPTMPPDNLQNFMVDPRMGVAQNGEQVMGQPTGVRAPRDLANRNALAVLLESILPWVDYGRGDGEHHPNDPPDQAN